VGVKRNREEGGDGREEEFPLGYAASEQLIRQRLAKEAEQKYIEKRIKKEKSKLEKRKFASQGELDKAASQKKNFRQSAQYQELSPRRRRRFKRRARENHSPSAVGITTRERVYP
jgi:hypothetical protein